MLCKDNVKTWILQTVDNVLLFGSEDVVNSCLCVVIESIRCKELLWRLNTGPGQKSLNV